MPSLPGRRPCSDPGPATTRAKNIAGRVGGGLVAAVTLAGLALPAALLLSTETAVAAATQAKAVTTAVTMTGMSPKWAAARSVITVSGLVTNTSKVAVRGWGVQLYASATPVTSPTVIGPNTVPFYEFAGIQPLAGARWRSHQIQPGHSVRWTIRVRARKIGMTQFGVYPLAAVARNRAGTALGASTSYLPYIPRKKGAYSATRPAREQISWVWPLIDKPMLGPPWQNACTGPQARALADSLRPGGRLANLVAAGRGSRGITWAVDPALLADAKSLTGCRLRDPGLARAAAAWLASVSAATAGQPLFAMPYGDPNAAALIRQNHQGDVKNAFRLGRNLASRILHRNLVPASSRLQAGAGSQANGIAWLPDGSADYATMENLAGYQIRVRTVVLSRAELPQVPGTVAHTPE